MNKLIRLALIIATFYGTGAHWSAIQGAAWASMIANRVSESSLADAVSSTFSGKKPCRVCKVVERGTTAKSAPILLRSGVSLDLAVPVVPRLTVVLPVSTPVVLSFKSVSSISSRPFVPPPKTVLPA